MSTSRSSSSSPRPRAPRPPLAGEALADLDAQWKRVSLDLLEPAFELTGSPVAAEDLVAEAYKLLASGVRAWDRARYPNVYIVAFGVMRSVAPRYRPMQGLDARGPRRDGGGGGDGGSSTDDGVLYPPSDVPDPETAVAAKQDLDRLAAALAGDELATSLLALARARVTDAGEQAERLGVPVDDVYDARQRMRRALQALFAADAREARRIRGMRRAVPSGEPATFARSAPWLLASLEEIDHLAERPRERSDEELRRDLEALGLLAGAPARRHSKAGSLAGYAAVAVLAAVAALVMMALLAVARAVRSR